MPKSNITFDIEKKTTKRGRPTKYATDEEKAFSMSLCQK